MTENETGKQLVDAAVHIHRKPGYFLNFSESMIKDGIIRIVNGLMQ